MNEIAKYYIEIGIIKELAHMEIITKEEMKLAVSDIMKKIDEITD